MDLGLRGKVAVITGGSSGIGLAAAEAVAAEGVDLLLVARGEQRLREQGDGVATDDGVRVIPASADRATAEGAAAVVAAAAGGVDLLVNNAGVGSNETSLEAPD